MIADTYLRINGTRYDWSRIRIPKGSSPPLTFTYTYTYLLNRAHSTRYTPAPGRLADFGVATCSSFMPHTYLLLAYSTGYLEPGTVRRRPSGSYLL